jgi:hypothetical protein
MAKTIQGFAQPAPSMKQSSVKPAPSIRQAANDNSPQIKQVSGSDVNEHGGGIGPRQHWQSMMQEGAMKQALDDYKIVTDAEFFNKYKMTKKDFYNSAINARNTEKSYKAPQSCPQCGKAHESCVCENIVQAVTKLGNDIPRKSVIQGYTVFYNPNTKTISVTHGGDSEEAAIDQVRLGTTSLKNFRMVVDKLIDRIENQVEEGWSDKYVAQRTGRPRTPYSVYINGKKWKDFENDDHARAVMDKLKAKFKADGRDPSVITIAPTDIPEGVTDYSKRRQRERDIDAGKPEARQRQPRMTDYQKKRAQDKKDMELGEDQDMVETEKEPTTRQELLNRVDKIQRMMSQDRNPANLQILRKELEMLKQRYQHLKEDNDSEAVEIAIIKRILVAHTDLIMEFGLDKVTQAIEEVAYNVGDVDEIGTSDVSAYVHQVKQILGVPEELDEKWSAKYKKSINCANPKGFSQRAHCAGRKK